MAVIAAAVASAGGLALAKDLDNPGSTQRFRGIVTAKKSESLEKAKAAAGAKVTLEQAVQAATQRVPGKVLGAELTDREMAVWDVEILSVNGKEVRLSVDAATGTVYEEQP